mmetsp:Transcript_27554/g.46571  ORF Transcript_27554/g.46571 Transcript_27554/m.46571 type:complete len:375 (-) Transcript_27554:780-1904(-)
MCIYNIHIATNELENKFDQRYQSLEIFIQTSPLIPVCNTTSVSQFIFYSHKADERRPGTSESLIKASSSREGSKRPKTSPPKNINPLDTSTAIGPQQRTTNFVIGAFIWNWRRQTLVLATRSPDGSHNLLVHKPERTVQESARGWHPPGGFFNDRQKKVTLSVDQFDEKRLATEATRLGLIPTESQWKTIQNYDLERLIEIVLQLGAKGLISCCDLLKMVEDKLLLKLMVEQGEEDQKQGKRKKISEGNILSQIICRKLRLQGLNETVRKLRRETMMNLLEMSNCLDYLNPDDQKMLSDGTYSEEEWKKTLEVLDEKHQFLKALSIRHIAKIIDLFTLIDIAKFFQVDELRDVVEVCGLASKFSLKRVVRYHYQ